jgi:putative flippase GtrA
VHHIKTKKPNTIVLNIKLLIQHLWQYAFVRFLFVGGINTLLGYLTTIILRNFVFIDDPKWILFSFFEIDLANSVMYLILFPLSYTLQALWSFRVPWNWKRLLVYPLSSLPNYLLNQFFIFIFETVLGLPPSISYAISAVLPIPVMFFIIRFLVGKRKTTEA